MLVGEWKRNDAVAITKYTHVLVRVLRGGR